MKKEYDDRANKRNIPNLDLYTKLLGFFWLSVGLNIFLEYIYYEFILPTEYAGKALVLSILMMIAVLIAMTDERKECRDFTYTVVTGIGWGIFSICSMWTTRFVLLYVACIVELLVILFWIIQNQRQKKRKKRNKRNKLKQKSAEK